MGRIGGGELLLILFVALLVFGPSKLADLGKGLGEGLKNFKKGLNPEEDEAKKQAEAEEAKRQAEAAARARQAAPPAPAPGAEAAPATGTDKGNSPA
jgi:sec-independent protein translocase protein TatA